MLSGNDEASHPTAAAPDARTATAQENKMILRFFMVIHILSAAI